MSKSISLGKQGQKSIFGDFLSGIVQPALTGLGTIAGSAFGMPGIGSTIGSSLGGALKNPLSKLKKGGVAMGKGKKPAHMVKGSKQAKAKMAKIRAMKKK
jgi:hypothetical protein